MAANLAACLLLCAVVVFVYAQTAGFGLVLADDINTLAYLEKQTDSFFVNVLRAVTTTPAHIPYWMPITMISYLLDYEIFNLDPGGYHMSSMLLHALTAILLFLVLQAITRASLKSFFATALWAIHPLNVSSVAWLAGRSTILSSFFLIGAIGCYAAYVNGLRWSFYWATMLAFLLALLSKPSAIYFPLVLLLLDYWPLGRYAANTNTEFYPSLGVGSRLIFEKIPFFLLVVVCIGLSLFFFKTMHMAEPFTGGELSSPMVFINSFVSIIAYIWKFIIPTNLPLYSPPVPLAHLRSLWMIAGSAAILVMCLIRGWQWRRQLPYLMTGLLFFLVPLIPHLAICVGQQQLVIERYAYVPVLGLSVIVAWGGIDILRRLNTPRWMQFCVIGLVLTAYMVVALAQAGHWKDTEHYFRHAAAMNPDSARTHSNFGEVLFNKRDIPAAIDAFNEALRLAPRDPVIHHNLGLALVRAGETVSALHHYQRAIDLKPDYVEAHNNMANLLMDTGRIDATIKHYRQALSIDPSLYKVHNNLAVALARKGEIDTAIQHLRTALKLAPGYASAQQNLDQLLRGHR
ncbi:MAG: tetratricopeptide repeat protein [Thermodesulfobacteriota bacterium]|nr:tetratricopeptide repeat protein [Thermodesulfobacteriota bacterium]